ncbi:MAG: serine/threonine-protein phosphatase [Candidatus Nanopelagicales bacterium]|nr:serine/threonine-protein phosphatase [Candidatus Nanopelagicales bacterium]
MTLRTRVLLVVAATLAITAAIGLQLVDRYTESRDAVSEVTATLAPAGAAAADLTSDINAMDRRLRIHVTSGQEGYLRLHQSAVASAERNLAELDGLVGDRRGYRRLLADLDAALADWLAAVAVPVEQAMQAGDQPGALSLLDSSASLSAHGELTAETARLSRRLAADQEQALAASTEATLRLARTIAVALGLGLLMPVLGYLALQLQVLGPIGRLRAQLRRTATPGQHDAVIVPEGPPELRDLGSDAEALRRALVRELDESDAARQALEQEGPVVEAIRRELAARVDGAPVGVHVAGALRPAQGVLAGDFWDRMALSDGRAAVIVCDVSGHGPRAGIIAMRLKTSITLGLIGGQEPTQILHRACDMFADEPGRFATVVLLVADPRAGTLEWVNAGHPAPRIVRADGRIERLDPTGPMVAWLVGQWSTGRTTLAPGDVCLAFTDGILESRDAVGAELGDEALDERLRWAVGEDPEPEEVIARVLADVRDRAEDLGRDDVTLVALRLAAPVAGIPAPR